MRLTKKRLKKLNEIKTLADRLGTEIVWKDFEDAPYPALCLVSIKLQLQTNSTTIP